MVKSFVLFFTIAALALAGGNVDAFADSAALSEAVSYDRCCAYFSSTVLSAAARGFGKLIERLIAMGQEDLGQTMLTEAERMERGGQMSAAGTKKLRYGTRKLK